MLDKNREGTLTDREQQELDKLMEVYRQGLLRKSEALAEAARVAKTFGCMVSEEIKARVRKEAGYRCGYCLSHQDYVFGKLEIEHIIPKVADGVDDETNVLVGMSLMQSGQGGANTRSRSNNRTAGSTF